MRIVLTSLIAVPLDIHPFPFPCLPIEIVREIFEWATWEDIEQGHSLLLISREVRRWVHPIIYETVEIFGLRKMIKFAEVFATSEHSLLATSVRNLSLYDDTTGDFVAPSLSNSDPSFLSTILGLCKGVRRVAINYIREIPAIQTFKPYEVIVRRGLRGIRLKSAPFEHVTHLHYRFEQLLPSFLPKITTSRLTHVCFTHHLHVSDEVCQEVVNGLLSAPGLKLQILIVEVAFQKWHRFEDPSVRRLLAKNVQDDRLYLRLSKYDTVQPYDDQRVFSGDGSNNVWDTKEDMDWRTKAWDKDLISHVYSLISSRRLNYLDQSRS